MYVTISVGVDVLWQRAKEYQEEDVGTAVDGHSTVLHIANAISVRDLCESCCLVTFYLLYPV